MEISETFFDDSNITDKKYCKGCLHLEYKGYPAACLKFLTVKTGEPRLLYQTKDKEVKRCKQCLAAQKNLKKSENKSIKIYGNYQELYNLTEKLLNEVLDDSIAAAIYDLQSSLYDSDSFRHNCIHYEPGSDYLFVVSTKFSPFKGGRLVTHEEFMYTIFKDFGRQEPEMVDKDLKLVRKEADMKDLQPGSYLINWNFTADEAQGILFNHPNKGKQLILPGWVKPEALDKYLPMISSMESIEMAYQFPEPEPAEKPEKPSEETPDASDYHLEDLIADVTGHLSAINNDLLVNSKGYSLSMNKSGADVLIHTAGFSMNIRKDWD